MEYKEAFERIKTFCNSDNGYPYNQYMQSSTPRNEDLEIVERALEDYSKIMNKIENGTLIEFPCKVGDTVYKTLSYGEIVEFVVMQINTITTKDDDKPTFLVFDGKSEPTIGIIGLDVFVSKEQAEAKLKELRSKE